MSGVRLPAHGRRAAFSSRTFLFAETGRAVRSVSFSPHLPPFCCPLAPLFISLRAFRARNFYTFPVAMPTLAACISRFPACLCTVRSAAPRFRCLCRARSRPAIRLALPPAFAAMSRCRRSSTSLWPLSFGSQALPQCSTMSTNLSRPGFCSPRSPAAVRSLPGLRPLPLRIVGQRHYGRTGSGHSATAAVQRQRGHEPTSTSEASCGAERYPATCVYTLPWTLLACANDQGQLCNGGADRDAAATIRQRISN